MKARIVLALCLCVFAVSSHAIERQEKPNWCWAASIQDVLAQVDIHVSQTSVAERLLGAPLDQPTSVSNVVALFNSYGLRSWRIDYPASPQQLQSTLNSGWRIVALAKPNAGPTGHFIVLEAADQSGNVLVSDPATGQTTSINMADLYYGWKWLGSAVVGQPKAAAYYRNFSAQSARLVDEELDDGENESSPNTTELTSKPKTTPNGYKRPDWMN